MALRLLLMLPELSMGLPSTIIFSNIILILAFNSLIYEFQPLMVLFKVSVQIRKLRM